MCRSVLVYISYPRVNINWNTSILSQKCPICEVHCHWLFTPGWILPCNSWVVKLCLSCSIVNPEQSGAVLLAHLEERKQRATLGSSLKPFFSHKANPFHWWACLCDPLISHIENYSALSDWKWKDRKTGRAGKEQLSGSLQ